ncbi:MAG TPA: aminodeoxychorismate/anthranilate synthase component II [Phycisphaerales bacterium]|nr:aminodeoxychorismate/anthranilate synthase component II [Phycisphaerales bacterium]
MILLIDNYDSFTWNLVQRLGELDPSLEPEKDLLVVRNDQISPAKADTLDHGAGPTHIIISPGPCTPREAGVSSDIIKHFAGRVPILGVCLGHQCMGALHGMTITQHDIPVHGKTSPVHHDGKGIFIGVDSPFQAMRYHSLVVQPLSVPTEPDAEGNAWAVSAWTDEDDGRGGTRRVVMGLRRVWADAGKAPLEGVQFHPESFMTTAGPKILKNFLELGETRQVSAAGPRP